MSTENLEKQILEIQVKIREFEVKNEAIFKEIKAVSNLTEYQQQKQEELSKLIQSIEVIKTTLKSAEQGSVQEKDLNEDLEKNEKQQKLLQEIINCCENIAALEKMKQEKASLAKKDKVEEPPKTDFKVGSISNIPKKNTTQGKPPRSVIAAQRDLFTHGWKKEDLKDGTKIFTAPGKNTHGQDIKFEAKDGSINVAKDVEYDQKVGDMLVKLAAAELAASKDIVVFHPDPKEAQRLADSLKKALPSIMNTNIIVTTDYKEYMDYMKNGVAPKSTDLKTKDDLVITEKTENESIKTIPKQNDKDEKPEDEPVDREESEIEKEKPIGNGLKK